MRKTIALIAAITVAALGTGIARAENVAVPASDPPPRKDIFDALDRINSDNALLQAQIQNASLRKKLADIQAGRDPDKQATAQNPAPGIQSFPIGPISTGTPVSTPAGPAPRSALVELVSTSPQINNGAPTALIQMPNGARVPAMAGTKLQGVGTVLSVSARAVLVSDGK